MGIKEYFIEKRLRKIRKNVKSPGIIPLEKIAVFWDFKSAFNENHLLELKEKFHLDIFDFEFFIFGKRPDNVHRFHGIDVLPGMINWQGKITNPNLRRLLDKPYGLLLDYTTGYHPGKNILLAEINAFFKAGFSENADEWYDLFLRVPVNDIEIFNTELIKYLKIIGLLK